MLLFALSLAATLVAMLVLERTALPRTRRPLLHRMSLLAAMPPLVFHVTIFMISYRPVFAMLATLIAFVTIIIVNNAKYRVLKEPIVFSDFALLRQAIEHPALYVKYIGPFKLMAVAAAAVAAIVGGMALEPPVIARESVNDYVPSALYLAVVLGLIYAVTRGPLRGAFTNLLWRFGPTADVRRDIDQLSLVVCLVFYFFLARERDVPAQKPGPAAVPTLRWWTADRPDVVVVQSESFFDARRLGPAVDPGLLVRFDELCRTASYHGRLKVPAWGANTMRTEFAFLSGLPNEALGVHRFNPYLHLCRRPVWTIAHHLRALGYGTVCVHPFPASFFDRKTVFPNLGFDTFLDIDAFAGAETFGPYVSDGAVAAKIAEVLGGADRPQFVFAITMENHGKWEADRLGPLEGEPPLDSPELAVYLRHLCNADRMVGQIADCLRRRAGDAVFCFYGDHVPSLPEAFAKAGYTDPHSDYVVWRKSGRHPRRLDVAADVLGRLVLDAVLNDANHVPLEVAETVPS